MYNTEISESLKTKKNGQPKMKLLEISNQSGIFSAFIILHCNNFLI